MEASTFPFTSSCLAMGVLYFTLLVASATAQGVFSTSVWNSVSILRRTPAISRRLLQSNIPGMPGSVAGRAFTGTQSTSATTISASRSDTASTSAGDSSADDVSSSRVDAGMIVQELQFFTPEEADEAPEGISEDTPQVSSQTSGTAVTNAVPVIDASTAQTATITANAMAASLNSAADSVSSQAANAVSSTVPTLPDRQLQASADSFPDEGLTADDVEATTLPDPSLEGSTLTAASASATSAEVQDSSRLADNFVDQPLDAAASAFVPQDEGAIPSRSDRQLQGTVTVLNGAFLPNGPTNFAVNVDNSVSISLAPSGGSGFTSSRAYSFGKFSVDVKLPAGYSAGVCACFFLISGDYSTRGEWDFEFLGSATDGSGMTLQTNYFMKGVGKHEVLTPFGFDPSADFHTYTIDWQPSKTVFYVDGKAIRTVEKVDDTYPVDPMTVAASIWDASEWATGTYTNRIPVDFSKAPFTATFKNFQYSAHLGA